MVVCAVVATAAFSTCARAHAEETATSLTYGIAIRDAQAMAPDLTASRARAAVAQAGVSVARIWANAVATAGSTRSGVRFYSTLTVPLPIARRGSAIRAAESFAEAGTAELRVLRLDAKLASAYAWCDLWLAEKTLELARYSEARAARISAAADQRFREGTAPQLDAVRARAEHARSRAEVLASTELVADPSATLAYWLGRDPAVTLHATGAPSDAEGLPAVAPLMARLESHPVLARVGARTRAAMSVVDVQESQAWPNLGVQLGAELGAPAGQNPTNNLTAALVVHLPIFNWNRPGIAWAERGVVQVTSESAAEIARLRSELVSLTRR
jgi:outer membrane protein TolC